MTRWTRGCRRLCFFQPKHRQRLSQCQPGSSQRSILQIHTLLHCLSHRHHAMCNACLVRAAVAVKVQWELRIVNQFEAIERFGVSLLIRRVEIKDELILTV